jgi:hypothetical protein
MRNHTSFKKAKPPEKPASQVCFEPKLAVNHDVLRNVKIVFVSQHQVSVGLAHRAPAYFVSVVLAE